MIASGSKKLNRRRALPITVAVLAACTAAAPPVITITAINYALQAPGSVAPGPARLRLNNAGTVPHEAQIFVFKPGISADSARGLLHTLDRVPDSLSDSAGAVLIAAPHTATPEEVYVDFQPGRVYALLCQFRDSANAPRHDRLGMFAVMAVAARN